MARVVVGRVEAEEPERRRGTRGRRHYLYDPDPDPNDPYGVAERAGPGTGVWADDMGVNLRIYKLGSRVDFNYPL